MLLSAPSPPVLPVGWDLDRIRTESMDLNARILDPEGRLVVTESFGELSYIELDPVVIIDFSGLCLVRDSGDSLWYMGDVEEDGSIMCWGPYGEDLGEAINSL